MHAILYRSTAAHPIRPADIDEIVDTGRRRNTLWSITGLLLYGFYPDGQPGFVQWLEGDTEGVEALFACICADARHTNVVRIATGRDLACYTLPTLCLAMCAIPVDCLPGTPDAFLAQAAALAVTVGALEQADQLDPAA